MCIEPCVLTEDGDDLDFDSALDMQCNAGRIDIGVASLLLRTPTDIGIDECFHLSGKSLSTTLYPIVACAVIYSRLSTTKRLVCTWQKVKKLTGGFSKTIDHHQSAG